MAFLTCDFFSEALGLCTSMNIIIPQTFSLEQLGLTGGKIKELPPVLYLLHGYSDNHTIWMRRTSVERYASEAGLAVIMPAVHLSYYTDMKEGGKYWKFISEELPEIVHSMFKVSKERDKTFLAGLSMGGYGAFKLALTYPERYRVVGSFSGALDIHEIYKTSTGEKLKNIQNIFGKEEAFDGTENDIFDLAKRVGENQNLKNEKKLFPMLYQCCGTKDFLFQANINFRKCLEEQKIDCLYEEAEGCDHTWDYWDKSIDRFISWIRTEYL